MPFEYIVITKASYYQGAVVMTISKSNREIDWFTRIYGTLVITVCVSVTYYLVIYSSEHLTSSNVTVTKTVTATFKGFRYTMAPSFIDVPDSAWNRRFAEFDAEGSLITIEEALVKLNPLVIPFNDLKHGQKVTISYRDAFEVWYRDGVEIDKNLSSRHTLSIRM